MRYSFFTWILLLLVTAMPAVAVAPYAPFVNDSTFAIVKVDPTQLDMKQIDTTLRMGQTWFPARWKMAIENRQTEIKLSDEVKVFDVITAITGGKPLYFVFSGCHACSMEAAMLVCFEHTQVSGAELEKVIGKQQGKFSELSTIKSVSSEDLVDILLEAMQIPQSGVLSRGAHGKTDYAFIFLPLRSSRKPMLELFSDLWPAVARPDLEAALKHGADAPVTIAVGLPNYVVETLKLLQPSETFDVGTIIEQGFRWASFTLHTKPLACNLTIQATSPDAAIACEKLLSHSIEKTIKLSSSPKRPTEQAALTALQKLVVPKVSGDQIQYGIIADKLDEAKKAGWGDVLKTVQQKKQRRVCQMNLKQIGIAMLTYESAHSHFPPAYSVDKNGKPLHSWRVLLLPFMEQRALYDKIRLDEPWDSEYNKQFHNAVVDTYKSGHDLPPGQTYYSVVVGDHTVFPPDGKKISFRNITDGTSNTAMVVERAKSVCWMEPTDLSYDELLKDKPTQELGNHHDGVWNILFCDGYVHTLIKKLDRKTLKEILTIDGGEAIENLDKFK